MISAGCPPLQARGGDPWCRSRHCSGRVRRLPVSVHFSGYSLSSPCIVVARMPTRSPICAWQTDTSHPSGSSEGQHSRCRDITVRSPKKDADGMTVSRDLTTLRSCLMSLWTSYGLREPLSSRQPPCCELRKRMRLPHAPLRRTRSRSRTWSSTAYTSELGRIHK